MNISIRLLSLIFKILKTLTFIFNEKYYFQKMGEIFEFSKKRIYVKEPSQVYMCTTF